MTALNRRKIVAKLLADRGNDLLVVPSLGQACYDCMAAGDSPQTFYMWGAMGGAVPVALGLAIAQPDKRVICIAGDGELLMGLGALAATAAEAPANFAIACLDNERYGETGQQHTATGRGANLTAIAAGAGFGTAMMVTTEDEVAAGVKACRETPGPVFVTFKVDDAPEEAAIPPKDGAYLKSRFREAVVGKI